MVKDEKMDVGVSAFGLSGNNVHIIVENYEQTVKKEETKKDNMMLKFSSTDKTALKSQLSSFPGRKCDGNATAFLEHF